MDQRDKILAKNLVNYSCRIQPNEKVFIEGKGKSSFPLVKEIIEEVYKAGGLPFTILEDETVKRELLKNITKEQLEIMAKKDAALMEKCDAYIGIAAPMNINELSDIPSENLELFSKYYSKPVHQDIRIKKTKWVVLRYPNPSMAQSAGISNEKFTDFFYNVCNLDYSKMSVAMDRLVYLMNKTDKVKIIGKGTNLEFSIKDIPTIKCDGIMNIPDGEVFTAPIRSSVNGTLMYNTPSLHEGFTFADICFTFKDGKITNATCNDSERLNKVLDSDEGARFIGEFAIGVNPYITTPMKNTLFDEKIMGSFHFTPGQSYDDAPNGNNSVLHWDLVCIQTKEYGGGEIYFDNILIRKDGIFVIDELKCLNPENLV